MSFKTELLSAIESRTARIAVVGMGYVGLPLAVEFAEAGFNVVALDVDVKKVDMLNGGQSYIEDIPSSRLQRLVDAGKLSATTDHEALRTVDAISICVPTPLRKTKDPDMSYIIQAVESIAEIAHEGLLKHIHN